MRPLLLVVLLGALALAFTGSVASLPDPASPLGAVAFVETPQPDAPGEAYLVWTPPAQMPDSYAIYGVVNGTLTDSPIATEPASETSAVLTEIYSGYAVEAVKDGVASPPTLALTLEEGCIHVYLGVPPGFEWGCSVAPTVPARVELMVGGQNVLS